MERPDARLELVGRRHRVYSWAVMSLLRRAAVAGSWYPGTRDAIRLEVDGYLAGAGIAPPPGRLVALVSPHAGLRYSGPVAAYGYSLLRGRADLTVVLVGPSHHVGFDGAAVYERGAWETPLGRAPIDEEVAAAVLGAAERSSSRTSASTATNTRSRCRCPSSSGSCRRCGSSPS
ncbi:MAG: AmmeMemoRadiSam system protein B [Vicinamibacteria bacterium]